MNSLLYYYLALIDQPCESDPELLIIDLCVLNDLNESSYLWVSLWVGLAVLLHLQESLCQGLVWLDSVSILQLVAVAQD